METKLVRSWKTCGWQAPRLPADVKETVTGKCECTLEVFDREKKIGFAMAAMAARVTFDAGAGGSGGGYIARYLSASEVRPEIIPFEEGHRLALPSRMRAAAHLGDDWPRCL